MNRREALAAAAGLVGAALLPSSSGATPNEGVYHDPDLLFWAKNDVVFVNPKHIASVFCFQKDGKVMSQISFDGGLAHAGKTQVFVKEHVGQIVEKLKSLPAGNLLELRREENPPPAPVTLFSFCTQTGPNTWEQTFQMSWVSGDRLREAAATGENVWI